MNNGGAETCRGGIIVTDQWSNMDSSRFEQKRSVSTPVRQGRGVRSPVRSYARRVASTDYRGQEDAARSSVDEREGKNLSIISHARNLPVESAKSATVKNMSFAVFMYGAVSELHSSLIGLTQHIEQSELEAKLQHIMNVIHVTSLNASPTDFKPVSWSVGRTYHNLVQAKVDSGRECWEEFNSLYRGSPHAAEMVAAEREHRTALTKVAKPERSGGTERAGERPDKSKKPLCSTWNDSESEGKCKWESENPGKTCNRSHHCTYCEKKGNSKTFHQERFCKKKLTDDK